MKTIIQVLSIITLFLTPAAAQEMQVKSVQGDEAVIQDRAGGQEWRARVGDSIGNGWTVVEVTDHLVTIEKEISPNKKVRGQMPVINTMQAR